MLETSVPASRFTAKLRLFYRLHIEERFLFRRSAEVFYRTFGGHILFQTLNTAMDFDLFTKLDDRKKMTLEEISAALNTPTQACRIMLLGLVASKILKKRGRYYKNTRVSAKLFNKNSPYNVASYVKLQHRVMYPALSHFTESVRSGTNVGLGEFPGTETTIYERIAHNPELETIFQGAMQELSLQSNSYLAEFLNLNQTKFLVDVGGGDGTNAMAFAERNPHLRAAVFDSPSVCKIAEANIKRRGFETRVTAIPGNAFKGDYPAGVDGILFCHFFTIWSKEENLELLKKAYSALAPGGRCMIFNMMQHNDETGPLSAAIGSPYFLACATGKGMLYTWDEYIELFKKAGFVNVTSARLPRDHGVITGSKPS